MNILIVGKNSFIGQGIGQWFAKKQPRPCVDFISVRDDGWKGMDLSGYDAVIFTAALVHRPDVTEEAEYFRLNAQLPYEFARFAKAQGVRQFLFFSSVSAYQSGRSLPGGCIINAQTPLTPDTLYGKSKRRGEDLVQGLADAHFHVSIVRPTYVYGKDCRGIHIAVQQKLSRMLPILPKAFQKVKLGMVYIDNLSELCWLIVQSHRSGVYHAQDARCLSTWEALKVMAPKKWSLPCTWLFLPFCRWSPVQRLFGGSCYDADTARCDLGDYQLISPAEGLRKSIK